MELTDIKTAVQSKLDLGTESKVALGLIGWDRYAHLELESRARQVMRSYQNANKWLDTIKEHLLMLLNLPHFSHIVHELAHTMPQRFDKFGDILHSEDLIIPYPSTDEWEAPCGDVRQCINHIYDILDSIKQSLLHFREGAESAQLYTLAIPCDELLLDIQKEYQFYRIACRMLDSSEGNLAVWDDLVYKYYNHQNELI